MNSLYITLGAIGTTEWIMIIAVVLLLFGGKKIPELMKGLGSGINEFKKRLKEKTLLLHKARKKKKRKNNF